MPENRSNLRRASARLKRSRQRASRIDRQDRPDTAPEGATRESTGLDELVRDLIRPNRSQVIMAVVLFFTALLTVTAIRARGAEADFSTMRRADLIQMLDTLNADSRSLEGEITKLNRVKEQLQSGADSAQVAQNESQRRLSQMRILAGTGPATGPGVRITIQDPNGKVGPELLLDAVEEMRDAGAEVISVNQNIRIVASSWFGRAADGSMVIDGVAVSKPLVIEAIGDPSTLEAGARFRGGLVSEVQNERVGGSVFIEQVDELKIKAVVTVNVPQFSRPA